MKVIAVRFTYLARIANRTLFCLVGKNGYFSINERRYCYPKYTAVLMASVSLNAKTSIR